MKILSIGNSFTVDAHRYFWELASNNGKELLTVGLYIGGCTLETHYKNLVENAPLYEKYVNGLSSGEQISIEDAVLGDDWDVITVQQASHKSIKIEFYTPFVDEIVKYLRKVRPNSKIVVHETWSYQTGSERIANLGFSSSADMFESVHASYQACVELIKADGLIKAGTAMQLAQNDGFNVHRDSFHASLGMGRLLLAAAWYKFFFGSLPELNVNADEPISDEEYAEILKVVDQI